MVWEDGGGDSASYPIERVRLFVRFHLDPARVPGVSIKPGGVSPRIVMKIRISPCNRRQRVVWDERGFGSRCRLPSQAWDSLFIVTWGSRPRLYAVACFRRLE